MAKTINITKGYDLGEIIKGYGLDEYQLLNICIGNDERAYLLFEKNEDTYWKSVPSKNTSYKILALVIDWENEELVSENVIEIGQLVPAFYFFQPIGDNYLIVGARAYLYKDGSFDKNAVIIDKDGNVLKEMCLGDGIEKCLVDNENRIITGYFDEGVFGNFGWNQPIGQNGLIVWNSSGEKIWENTKYEIYDCYALNIDESNNLWFYYYSEFGLVKTDYLHDIIFNPGINGASEFLINKSQTALIFDGGYDNHNKFTWLPLEWDRLKAGESCEFVHCDKIIQVSRAFFRSSKAVLINDIGMIYFKDVV